MGAIAMGRLTTHVLDTARGRPGAGITVELYAFGEERRFVMTTTTDHDGRCPRAAPRGRRDGGGRYELVFHAGDYYRDAGIELTDPPFLDRVVIRFGIASPEQHYHVPLFLSPYGYSTYRGS